MFDASGYGAADTLVKEAGEEAAIASRLIDRAVPAGAVSYRMETELGMIGGNIFHGELSAEQLFHMRPAPGYADFRTPIAGLYQASSATHGGGGVCGIPAYQAFKQMERNGGWRG